MVIALGVKVVGFPEERGPEKVQNPGGPVAEQKAPPIIKTPGPKARLLVIRGLKTGEEFLLFEGPNFIGRTDDMPVEVDLTFQEPAERIWSSRQHAVIFCEKGTLVLDDLDSSNETHVNRKRVVPGKKQELKANDVIQIGEVQLKVQ